MSIPLPQIEPRHARRNSRRRAIMLVLVHVLVGLHVIHFVATGRTVSPVEPSEAGYTIATGAINAGTIFLVLLLVSTLVFGRFFCGWACHVVAYQDAARWVLMKCGITPRPVRARLLMFVPLFAAYWLYGRPLIDRFRTDRPIELSWELMTTGFWDTFPGLTISILTFVICGAIIVYVLGAKGFCTYGCPYGALFGITDEFARGRIRVSDACRHSGHCTRNCSSNVDVASEVARFGMVVDPGCLKCLDCVAGCPNEALSFSMTPRSAAARSRRPPRLGLLNPRNWGRTTHRKHDLSWIEEIALIVLFSGLFAITYYLYRMVPFLLAVGLSAVLAFVYFTGVRLLYRRDVELQQVALKTDGSIGRAGVCFAGVVVVLMAATVHSGVMKYHSWQGARWFTRVIEARQSNDTTALANAMGRSRTHLAVCRRWGLFPTRGLGRMTGEMHRYAGEFDAAVREYDRELEGGRPNPDVPFLRAIALYGAGHDEEAATALMGAPAISLRQATLIDGELARLGDERIRVEMLSEVWQDHPDDSGIAIRLASLLARPRNPVLRDLPRAVETLETSRSVMQQPDADLLALLARLFDMTGKSARALDTARESLQVARQNGQADIARDMEQMVEYYRTRANPPGE